MLRVGPLRCYSCSSLQEMNGQMYSSDLISYHVAQEQYENSHTICHRRDETLIAALNVEVSAQRSEVLLVCKLEHNG